MAVPINIGQPSLALQQSIVTQGMFPQYNDNPYGVGTAATLGFVVTTAFEYSSDQVLELTPAEALVVHEATEGELITSLLLSAESQSASIGQVSGGGLFVVG